MENLDAMTRTELWKLWTRTHCRPRIAARELFPMRQRGYVRTAESIGHYACNKSVAMDCRLRGDIQAALIYEHICENIYDRLPDYARW